MLTRMGSAMDRLVGLKTGADDYLCKPFEPAELRSRIKAVLRRTVAPVEANGRPPGRIRIGRCVVDVEKKTMFNGDGEKVALTSMEFDLFYIFIFNPKRVLTCDQLPDKTHPQHWDPFGRSIDPRITRLRKRIEIDPAKSHVLCTVRGAAYALVLEGE